MSRAILVTVALAALASACTTMTAEERRAADEKQCRSYGFTKKNDAFAACLQRIDLDRRAARRDIDTGFYRQDPWTTPVIIYRPAP